MIVSRKAWAMGGGGFLESSLNFFLDLIEKWEGHSFGWPKIKESYMVYERLYRESSHTPCNY